MRRFLRLSFVVTLVLMTTVFTSDIFANDSTGYRGTFNLKVGHYGAGTMKINDREYETDDGLCFGSSVDFPVSGDFFLGVAVDAAQIKMWHESEYLLNVGLILKKRFSVNNGSLLIRPAAVIGHAMLNEIAWVDNTTYLTLQIFNEVVVVFDGKVGMLWDVGLFWALSGGNDKNDISGGPFLLIRFGLSI